jgi:DNA-binding CsgD family transcriptional regulator
MTSSAHLTPPSSSPLTELLERDAVIERIRGLTLASASGEGALAAIVGRPGEGKTALLGEACRIAAAEGLRVLRARGSDLERGFALGVARQLLEPAVRALAPDERARVLEGAAGLASGVLDIDTPRSPEHAFAALHGLYWLLAGLAESQPLLLALDDAHWADPATLHWLSYLSRRLDELPVLVVIAARPAGEDTANGEPLAALTGDPRVVHLQVAALHEDAVETLIERNLGAAPERPFTLRLHHVTAGNPLALHELLSEQLRAGVAPTAAAAERLGERAPDALQRNVLARLRRLPPAAALAAHALAVLGDGSPPRQIAALGELEAEAAARALDSLAGEGLLAEGPAPAFAHPLLRTAVHDALPARRRARLHARAAAILREDGADPEATAAHLLLCDPEGSPPNLVSLRAAAAAAIRRGAPPAAVAYLTRALVEPPPAAERAALLAELAHAEILIRSPAAIAHLDLALAQSEDPVARARLRWQLSDALLFTGEWDPALAQLEQAVRELGTLDPDLTLRLEGRLLTLGTLDARVPRAADGAIEQRLTTLLEQARLQLPGARPLRLNLALLLTVRCHEPAQAQALIEAGLDGGRFLEHETADAIEAVHGAFALVLLDDLEGALALTDAMLADAAARGSVLGFLAGSTFRTLAHLRGGSLPEAEADAFGALELAREQQLHFTVPFIAAYLALTLLERGRLEAAAELLAPIPLPPALAGTPAGITLLEARGRMHRARGNLASARADLRACGASCEAIGVRNPNVAAWRSELALTLRSDAPAHEREARELVARELELARLAGIPRGVGVALRVSAALAPVHERETLLREALTVLERSPARLELARALVDLGAHLRREGHRTRARDPLLRGLELAHACRAEPLAALAHDELLAAGARPRRPWLTGVDALTPSELRVARLAGAGASNREIAQALFITTPTVKGHLSSAYRKLGITARRELAAVLAPQSPDADLKADNRYSLTNRALGSNQ